jgi:HK97 family phage major capsid protein
MNLVEMKQERARLVREVADIRDRYKNSTPSETDMARARLAFEQAQEYEQQIAKSEASLAMFEKLKSVGPDPQNHLGSKGMPPIDFKESDLRNLFEKTQNRENVSLKAAVDSTDAPMAQTPYYVPGVFAYLREQTRVAEFIPTEMTTASRIDYFKLTTGAVNAATVAEGATKPTSNPVVTSTVAQVRKIAHVASMTDEVINDYPPFLQFIGQEMLAGLLSEENAQLLLGDGTGTNLTGLVPNAGITRARSTDTALDAIAKAMTDLRVGSSFVEPDCVILHPTDFQTLRLAKSTTNEYLASDPLANQSQNIWGTKVVVTTGMTAGTALVANLASAAKIYLREPARIDTSRGGAAEFTANIGLIRAEERLALTIVRPNSIVKVTGL